MYMHTQKQSSKWKFEFTGPNQILEFILYIYTKCISKLKLKNVLVRIVLLVLGQRTGDHREDCKTPFLGTLGGGALLLENE